MSDKANVFSKDEVASKKKTPATPRVFRAGQVLFKEGDPSKSLFLIRKGTVSVRRMKEGSYVEIARIRSNELIGELSYFDRQPRSATAAAVTEVEALELSFEAIDKLFVNVPDYVRSIMACVADRLRKSNDIIRRLQKVVVDNKEEEDLNSKDVSATAVLEATKNAVSLMNQCSVEEPNDVPATSPPATKRSAD